MATLADLKAALETGRNLALVQGRMFLITALDPSKPANSVTIASLERGKGYVTKPEEVTVVGSVDPGVLPWQSKIGKDGMDATPSAARRGVPFRLSDGTLVEPGTQVITSDGKTATYIDCNYNRPKFPLVLDLGGRRIKATAGYIRSVAGAAPQALTPDRTEAILRELSQIECDLSPENLSCDGELPRSQVKARGNALQARQRALHAELGRIPSYEEVNAAGERAMASWRAQHRQAAS